MKNNYICKGNMIKMNIRKSKMKYKMIPQSEIVMAEKLNIDCLPTIYSLPIPQKIMDLKVQHISTQNCRVTEFVAFVQTFIFETDGIFIDFKKLRKMVIRRLRLELSVKNEN